MTAAAEALPPSPSGARLTGDDLQHLIGWYWALKALAPEFAIESVALESLNAGNLDDIEVHFTAEAPQFWQVKATTSATEQVSSDWLKAPVGKTGTSILQRFYVSYLKLRAEHGEVRMVLATNRSLDTDDAVLRCRNPEDLLAPILRQKRAGDQARAGLRDWAAHIGITEAELLEMLDVLQIRTDVTESSFRERVTDISRLRGLRTDETALLAGTGTVRKWIRKSRAAKTPADIQRDVDNLRIKVGSPSGLLTIAALAPLDASDATVSLDWIDRFNGDDPRTRRGLKDPAQWNTELLPELRQAVADVRHRYDRVSIRAEARLPIWFATGSELSEVSGATVSSLQNGDPWPSDATAADGIEVVVADRRTLGEGNDIAIAVAIADDITPDVLAFALRDIPTAGTALTIAPSTGAGSRAVRSAEEAIALALKIKVVVRDIVRQERPDRLHLFLAMPHGLALLLGHLWDRMPPTQLYEDLTNSAYEPAFTITNLS